MENPEKNSFHEDSNGVIAIPTAEEFSIRNYDKSLSEGENTENLMIQFAKLHVEAALKAASREAVMDNREYFLNAYPLENIK